MKRKKTLQTVNLSSSFIFRSKCKFCGKSPFIYYYANEKHLSKSPTKPEIYLITRDWFIDFDPVEYKKVSTFMHSTNYYKNFNPSLHKNRMQISKNLISPYHKVFNEFLLCPCSKTTWSFTNKNDKKRPEVLHRKSRLTSKVKIR